MARQDAIAAVAARRGLSPQEFEAQIAPPGSLHDGLWYVQERDFGAMLIDDCVWIVFPNNTVARGIPVGKPIHPPTPPDQLRQSLRA